MARLTRTERWVVGVIAVIIVAGAALRATAIGTEKRVSRDEFGDGANADAILTGSRYQTLRWAPGTPLVFAAAAWLDGQHLLGVGPHSHGPAQYAQLAIEIVTLALIAVVAWLTAGCWAALLAVALAATYVPLILITRTYLSEPLGGLAILGTFAIAAFVRERKLWMLCVAGALAGLACLIREDLVPGVVVIAIAVTWAAWADGSRRRAARRGAAYLGCALLVIAPWAAYASHLDGRFVPITDGGTDALFVGTYLPGDGVQYKDVAAFRGPVCRAHPAECPDYELHGTKEMLALVASRYPHSSFNAAITKADLHNLRVYALGRPVAFTAMMARKLWRMWGEPWSGGNGFGRHPSHDTSQTQHLVYVGLALIGLIAGAFVLRRWVLATAAIGLAAITVLNLLVNAQGRDNLRLLPLVFAYGCAGCVGLARRWATR